MKRTVHPGQTFDKSGQYKAKDQNGINLGYEVTGVKNKTVPPGPKPGVKFVLTDPTKHKPR